MIYSTDAATTRHRLAEWERKAQEALAKYSRITEPAIAPQFNGDFVRGYSAGYKACLKMLGLFEVAKEKGEGSK